MFTSSDKGEALSHSIIVVITWRQVNLHCVTSLRKRRCKSFYCSLYVQLKLIFCRALWPVTHPLLWRVSNGWIDCAVLRCQARTSYEYDFMIRLHVCLENTRYALRYIYTVSQKKTVQISFCQNFVKFPPILVIFGRKIAKRLKLCEVYSFSTSPNSHHHTTVLNADVPNCYTTLKVVICNKLSNDLISTQ